MRRALRFLTIAAWVLALVPASLARGESVRVATQEQVIPLVQAPLPPAPPQVPSLEPPPNVEGLAGKPISGVSVVLEGNVWSDVKAPLVTSVASGQLLTPAVARRALDELLASGRFARGSVSLTQESAGVRIVLHVVPRKRIGHLEVEIHGAPIDIDEVLRTADLSDGGELVGADVAATNARIARLFAQHGYPSAIVDLQARETQDVTRAMVLLDVKPGVARRIDERDFYLVDGNATQIATLTRTYGVAVHDRADEPNLDTADAGLEQLLRSQGWHRAAVTHDLVRIVATDEPAYRGRVVLRVRVDLGPLRVPRFEGNEHYDAPALTGALALDTETDRSPSHLADRLRSFYQKRGFLDVDVRTETRGGENDPVQFLVFHIDEHRRVRVVARRFPCLKEEAIAHLSGGGPRSSQEIGNEIDSYLEEELPGADVLEDPDPRGVSATLGAGAGHVATGARPAPIDLTPDTTYVADTYERAVEHVQELYRNEGFLHAVAGPVQVVRARCDPRSPAQRCVPLPLPPMPTQLCTYDAAGLPLPPPPLDPALACIPDAAHGVECAPRVALVIPVKLGPRTTLWDVAFTGVKRVSEEQLAAAADLSLGEPGNAAKLEDARRRIVDWYKERGYAYADAKYALEPSPDNTRARVRFDVIEGDQVIVRDVVVRGLVQMSESVVRRRIAIEAGLPYRTSDVRRTQERVATLGVFSSVTVGLSDPHVPGPSKTVIVDVVERVPQYVEVQPGFSTGEGVRGAIEYGHRDLLGYAWAATVHLQASYLPDFLILDPAVAANYAKLSSSERIATRDTVTLAWPEMGLGPTVRAQIDGVYVRDLERDFTLLKGAAATTILWRPVREIQLSGGPDVERNDVHLFEPGQTLEGYISSAASNPDLARLLRVPDGDSLVGAARLVFTWDRRDSAFNAHRGTYVALGIEQVNSYPVRGTAAPNLQFESHFLRLTQTLAAYLPITKTVTFAAEVRLGEIANVASCKAPYDTSGKPPPTYCTYPDRLFFMGGVDSMRGWLQDAFIPQEYVDQIVNTPSLCTSSSNCSIPLRGGNLMINPRFELRFPLKAPIDGAIFSDLGNLWNDPSYIYKQGLTLRADVGAGVRVQTPVGPLVFDYGVNVTRKSYEDFGAFHFAIGLF